MIKEAPLTCHPEPAHLLPGPAVLPHKEGVGGAAAFQQTSLVAVTEGDNQEQEEQVKVEKEQEVVVEGERYMSPHHSHSTDSTARADLLNRVITI